MNENTLFCPSVVECVAPIGLCCVMYGKNGISIGETLGGWGVR